MKRNLVLVAALALTGCAYISSSTTKSSGGVEQTEKTTMTAYALFDAGATFAKFKNAAGGTNGTVIGSVNESASSTNLAAIIEALAKGVVSGLK